MSFFNFPSSSTGLPGKNSSPAHNNNNQKSQTSQFLPNNYVPIPPKTAPSNTGEPDSIKTSTSINTSTSSYPVSVGTTASTGSSLFKFAPKLSSSPTISTPSASTKNTNKSMNTNTTLYCKRRHNQIIELNSETLQLNLIGIDREDNGKSTASFALCTLQTWPAESSPKRILCNELGNLLVIQGTAGNITVIRISSENCVTEEIEIEGVPKDLASVTWHPASPADHHLVVLGRSGRLLLFDLLQVQGKPSSSDSDDVDDQRVLLLRISEAEQIIKLPVNRTDSFASILFVSDYYYRQNSNVHVTWLRFTAFLVKEGGDIFALCPLVPLKFRAQRQGHLIPLKYSLTAENDAVAIKWLDEVVLSGQFVANSAGDTDWILSTCPSASSPSFSHLQPRLQGPFLIQPEPMEIHQLSAYDQVVDFSSFHVDKSIPMLAIAFGSGKVDLLALCSEILPQFQLKKSLIKSQIESDSLPILALIESIDLKGSAEKSAVRRSVDGRIKFLSAKDGSDRESSVILASTDDSVVRINLKIVQDDSDWTFDCESTILIDKLKSHVLCISEKGTVYPGAFILPDEWEESSSSFQPPQSSSLLENVTKFAFPLGRMEIEGGAVQLDGLIENLIKNLTRLKSHFKISDPTTSLSLPNVNETAATELNDHVAEWQETLVIPTIRIGHEISLRSDELVKILCREREILLRAKTLLTSKPERLENLLLNLSGAKEKNRKLLERIQNVSIELSKYSQYDELLIEKLNQISMSLSKHSQNQNQNQNQNFVDIEDIDAESDNNFVKEQVLIQSEKLLKLKNQLKQII